MNQKTVKTLGIATAVTLIGAVAFNALRDRGTAASTADEPLLPALQDRINDVRTVVIENRQETLTLTGRGAEWQLVERSGYPARADSVRALLIAFRDARLLEEKTSNPARFGQLGLDAPDAEGSRSTRLTLEDEGGEEIGTVLVGNRRPSRTSPQDLGGIEAPEEQYYVHPGGEGPTYLAIGKLSIAGGTGNWIEQVFVNVPRERIAAVRIAHPDGEIVTAVREPQTANDMVVLDIPEGMVAKEPSGTSPLLNALAGVRFDDVRKVDAIDWESHPITTAEIFTEHGLRVTVESIELPKEDAPDETVVWARFRYDVAPEEAPVLAAVETEDAVVDGGSEGPADGEADGEADGAPSEADLLAEANTLAATADGWAYALPAWKSVAFRMRVDSLIQPEPEPEPEPETEPEPDTETETETATEPPGSGAGGDGGL